MTENVSEQKQRILYLTDLSYLVEEDVKQKIHDQIDVLSPEALNNIFRVLEEGNKKEKEFLTEHIKKHPEFPEKISRFIADQFRMKNKEVEAQDRAHDNAEILDLEKQIQTL